LAELCRGRVEGSHGRFPQRERAVFLGDDRHTIRSSVTGIADMAQEFGNVEIAVASLLGYQGLELGGEKVEGTRKRS
jgi:hypothetical protein